MIIENLILKAVRNKFRFESKAGLLSVEQLFDLPLTSNTKANLQDTAREISRQLREVEEDFVGKKAEADQLLQDKLEIVKGVIEIRQAEAQAKAERDKKSEQRQKLSELIERKRDSELEGKSLEELQELLKSL